MRKFETKVEFENETEAGGTPTGFKLSTKGLSRIEILTCAVTILASTIKEISGDDESIEKTLVESSIKSLKTQFK